MVSARRLRGMRRLPRAAAPWVIDSGGFTELSMYGRWTVSHAQYVEELQRFVAIGLLAWAAPQDWMCEPWVLAKTGLTVAEHQERTTTSVLALRAAVRSVHVIPVLQGWTADDYWRHVNVYRAAGVDLRDERIVGLGSICRRQGTAFAARLVEGLQRHGLKIHGFGIKSGAAMRWLESADSMAWSYGARRDKIVMPGCVGHINCANCLPYALHWRAQRLAGLAEPRAAQMDLFAGAA